MRDVNFPEISLPNLPFLYIDLSPVINSAVADRQAAEDRRAFVGAVAAGVPASEAYADLWSRRR